MYRVHPPLSEPLFCNYNNYCFTVNAVLIVNGLSFGLYQLSLVIVVEIVAIIAYCQETPCGLPFILDNIMSLTRSNNLGWFKDKLIFMHDL